MTTENLEFEICILESLSSSRSSKPTFVQACHLKGTSLKTPVARATELSLLGRSTAPIAESVVY
jgi:hypothetical protein